MNEPILKCSMLRKKVSAEECIIRCEFSKKNIDCIFRNLLFPPAKSQQMKDMVLRELEQCHKLLKMRGIDKEFAFEKSWNEVKKDLDLQIKKKI